KKSVLISRLAMLSSGILMGNVGLIISFLSRFSVFTIVFFRGLFGIAFLSLVLLINKSITVRFIIDVFKKYWKWLLIILLINPLVIYFYFVNILMYNYSIAAFLLYTGGIFLLIFLLVFKEEKVSLINIGGFIIAIVGIAIIMEFWNGKFFSLGLFIGLLSGITLGILTFSKKKIYNSIKKQEKELSSEGDINTFLAWWGTLGLIIYFFPCGGGNQFQLNLFELVICILLGLLPTALAFTLYNIGIRNDKGGNIVILSYFEPVVATLNTIIFLREFSIFTIIGGSLILLANFVILRYSK
ncbi:MAG: EamA family transporter, partial [Candidatus Lokiarchaeota archaeon]